MDSKKKGDTPNFECIAEQIIKILHKSRVTYKDTETILEYVRCKLWDQFVQDSD